MLLLWRWPLKNSFCYVIPFLFLWKGSLYQVISHSERLTMNVQPWLSALESNQLDATLNMWVWIHHQTSAVSQSTQQMIQSEIILLFCISPVLYRRRWIFPWRSPKTVWGLPCIWLGWNRSNTTLECFQRDHWGCCLTVLPLRGSLLSKLLVTKACSIRCHPCKQC